MDSLTPTDAARLLLDGNRRFAANTPVRPNQDAARRAAISSGQHPFAVVFECSDSRVAAEIIFDCGLGDLFVVRTAGHVMGPEVLGSIEFGVAVPCCPLVAIVGHESCGALAAASAALTQGETPPGYIRDVVERVTPSVLPGYVTGQTSAQELPVEHVRNTLEQLVDRSRALAERVEAGTVGVLGLCYSLASGRAEVVAARGLGPIDEWAS